MDVSIPMTATQLTLIWILLGCLLTWMLLFALLALRPEKNVIQDKFSATTTTMRSTTPTPAVLHVLAPTPASSRQTSTGQLQHEVNDPHSMPVGL